MMDQSTVMLIFLKLVKVVCQSCTDHVLIKQKLKKVILSNRVDQSTVMSIFFKACNSCMSIMHRSCPDQAEVVTALAKDY